MTPALTPGLALDYLHELSADVRGGVVLGAAGEPVAGDSELAVPAAAVVAAMGEAADAEAVLEGGAVLAARGEGLALVLVYGPRVLPGLARHDLRQALADLGVPPPGTPATVPQTVAREHAEALILAAHRGPGEDR